MRLFIALSIVFFLTIFYLAFSYNQPSMTECTKSHDIATCYEAFN